MENLKFAKLVKKTRQIERSLEKFDFPKLIGTHRSTLSITYELEGLSDSSGKYAHKQENEQRWSQTHCRYDSQWSTLNAWKDQSQGKFKEEESSALFRCVKKEKKFNLMSLFKVR